MRKKVKVVVGVSGSIAAYKAIELVRLLKEKGADVQAMLTHAACKFVSPASFAAICGHPVLSDIFDQAGNSAGNSWETAHLKLGGDADIIIIAPATCDTIAKLANGICDEIVTACVLSSRAPVLIAPAMHESMWMHPATQRNVKRLKSYGYKFIGPVYGKLSNGELGLGRMSEPPEIARSALKGKR